MTIDLKVQERDRLEFDVKRCRYAEMYRELGMAELGRVLSCNRDGAFCTGFNPAIRLTRTQTIMAGAECCDFRYKMAKGDRTPRAPERNSSREVHKAAGKEPRQKESLI